jgi:uncharacterized membrane protein
MLDRSETAGQCPLTRPRGPVDPGTASAWVARHAADAIECERRVPVIARLFRYVRSSLWAVPVACVLAGAAVSTGTIAIDRAFDYEAIPSDIVGGPDAAGQILSTVATSMVSLAALVLTITMVVVQLAMGQFSPRIVQRILQDKPSQLAIGLFVATFVHAILALREVVNEGDGTGQVPGVAVITAFVLVLASIAVLVIYVHHIGRSLRVSALIELVGKDTRKLLDRVYQDQGPPLDAEEDGVRVIRAMRSGVVTKIAHEDLVEAAASAGAVVELVPAIGQFVPADAALFRIRGSADGVDEDALHEAVTFDLERTLEQDVAYGIRLLVDIAQRSMSDSPLQDPTTAVQAIDRLHDILRQLARRPFPDGTYRDAGGDVRLRVPTMSWEAYVRLAFEEVRRAGAGSPQVSRRMMSALEDLLTVAPEERRGPVAEQIRLLESATEAADDDHHAGMGIDADREGIGIAAGGPR